MKKELRCELSYLRDNLEDRYDKSLIITNKILELDIYKESKAIGIYNSIKSEVDTKELIKNSLELEKVVLLPRIRNNKMEFIKIDKSTKYEKSNYNILEPIGNVINNMDLIIVPGLAFDKNNNRLGYGKGYYDKYLKNKEVYKIGICFKEQLISNIPVDNNDIKMDMVITD